MDKQFQSPKSSLIMTGSKFTPSPQHDFDGGAFRCPSNSPRFSPQNRFQSPNQHHLYYRSPNQHPYHRSPNHRSNYSTPNQFQCGSPMNWSPDANASFSSGSGSHSGSFVQSPYDTFRNNSKNGEKHETANLSNSNSGCSRNIELYYHPSMLQDPWKELMQKYQDGKKMH